MFKGFNISSGRSVLVALAALSFTVISATGSSAGHTPTTNVLLIGNSFTKSTKGDFCKIAKATNPSKIKLGLIAKNGASLGQHLAQASFEKKVAKRTWDYVVIQEQSKGIWDDIYHFPRFPHAREMVSVIRKHSPAAKIFFLMTWRDREHPLVAYESLKGGILDNEGYVPIAHELGAAVIPAGWVYRQTVVDGRRFDLWSKDGHHSSKAGRWAVAATMYTSMFGESLASMATPYIPKNFTVAERDYLPGMIDQVVSNPVEPWNLAAVR